MYASEVKRSRNEAAVDRQDAACFSIWLKEGHGQFKSAMKTEDAEGYQLWEHFL